MKRHLVLIFFFALLIPVVSAYWTYYNASSYNVLNGTLTIGTLESVYAVDGDIFTVQESGEFEVYFNFSDVPHTVQAINIVCYGHYQGNPAHVVNFEIYNYSSGSWVIVDRFVSSAGFQWHNISASNWRHDYLMPGDVFMVRIHHESPANPVHHLYIDYLQIKGIEEVEPTPLLTPILVGSVLIFLAVKRFEQE